MADAADRLANDAVVGTLTVRARLPVTADADHDEAGIYFRERCVAESPRFERTRAKILDQEIAFGDQRFNKLLAARLAQVHADQRFVAKYARGP